MEDIKKQTEELIDNLKATCAGYGLGNDGNEFKIITQMFLYKFLNDKFGYELKNIDERFKKVEHWETEFEKLTNDEYEELMLFMGDNAKLKKEHLLSNLFNNMNQDNIAEFLDDTLIGIANYNNAIFSVRTDSNAKIELFERISNYITDPSKRNDFARAIISKLCNFNFEKAFGLGYDFFAIIFEYLIKDYNKDGGGKYAEYYTPRAVAKIMAKILVGNENPSNVTCYDPSAGSGTLLMSIAHAIGTNKCTIFSQDISQKSSTMLRLNLILNNLIHSIPNIVQGNTLTIPAHTENDKIKKFDYIVSNPPFKLDFSDDREDLDTEANKERFFAGIPNIPNKDKDKMAIYLCFLQHIMYSLADKGKAAVVVPTGFLTASPKNDKIAYGIRQKLIDKEWLRGVISMPSNIFATTGTNVSVLFIDKENQGGQVLLMDASKLGTKVKEGKNQKTVLSEEEENKIIETFNKKEVVDDFSILVSYENIKNKNYSFSAGQYFDVKIEYVDITAEEFEAKMNEYKSNLNEYFEQSHKLENEIQKQLELLKYE